MLILINLVAFVPRASFALRESLADTSQGCELDLYEDAAAL
jgi:hypothetical protein